MFNHSSKKLMIKNLQPIPDPIYVVNAQAWTKDHIARIASMRVETSNNNTRGKIRSQIIK